MLQGSLDIRALFTDQTEEFLRVQSIKPPGLPGKKGVRRYLLHFKVRTAAGDVDRCTLLTERREYRMRVEKENERFIYFGAEIETGPEPFRYAFRLRLADSKEFVLYTHGGVRLIEAVGESAAAAVAGSVAGATAAGSTAGATAGSGAAAVAGSVAGVTGGSAAGSTAGATAGSGAKATAAGSTSGAPAGPKNKKRPPDTDGWWYFVPGFKVPEWSKGAVMYQIFVDRFYNGDPDNDPVTAEYAYNGGQIWHIDDWNLPPAPDDTREHYGGDLQGIMDKLDYLEDLGVEVIYLNPIFVSPSNHKYDTQDYSHVDPHFGKIVHDSPQTLPMGSLDNSGAGKYRTRVTDPVNLEASDRLFANLVREAHMRGIRVILDGVFNHCGSFHRWLDREKIYGLAGNYAPGAYRDKNSPYNSYFKFKKDAWPNNGSYESWWDLDTLPKLNYEESEELCREILTIAAKWVSPPYNVDGWRLDVAADLGHSEVFNHKFWKRFRSVVKKANPEAIILAENYFDSSNWLHGDEWDTIMNYEGFMDPVTWFLTGMEKHGDIFRKENLGNSEKFWEALQWREQQDMPMLPLMCSMNQLSNHDHSRFLTRTGMKVGRLADLGTEAASENVRLSVYREAAVMQMTLPGAPTLYYGDETGVCGFTDPDNRRTYPWGREDKELIRFHKEIIRMHKEYQCLRTGSLLRLSDTTGVLSYARFDRESTVVVAVNNLDDPVLMRIPVVYAGVRPEAHMKLRFLTNQSGFVAYPRTTYKLDDGYLEIEVEPESAAVLVHER